VPWKRDSLVGVASFPRLNATLVPHHFIVQASSLRSRNGAHSTWKRQFSHGNTRNHADEQ